jgi:hypothetical protein
MPPLLARVMTRELPGKLPGKLPGRLCDSCKRLIALFGTNEFAVPWRCTCNATDHPDNQVRNVQYQLGLKGAGDYCRLGCCDFSDQHAKHTCKREQRS